DPLPAGAEAGAAPAAGRPRTPSAGSGRGRTVLAPVRISDAATVGLLRPGDRVDVIATPVPPPSGAQGGRREPAGRIVAAGVRVQEIPDASADAGVEGGALLVLSVTRAVAADLASAGVASQLAVTVC
ncbi:RcpC/CpaB family pilus assembly protein, partial [Streptomyces fuscigenes]|uniref:RcpC/CpaB family pilus assembly protein n=1 Tax=Streptomyces fuscigenes TaxID=1528880 RepID=UPI001F3B4786